MHAPGHPIRVYADQFGERFLERGADGAPVERLVVSPVLAAIAEFRRGVSARTKALSTSPALTLARVFEAEASGMGELTLRAEPTEGERLSALIARRRDEQRPFTLDQLLYLLRGAVSAVRELHSSGNGVCHGAVAAGRFVLATDGRLVLHDCVFGSALASLAWPPSRLREVLGLRVPELPDIPAFTPLTDQFQLGLLAFHLATGDAALPGDPAAALAALAEARLLAVDGDDVRLPGNLQKLIARTLLLSADGPFRSLLALERALDSAVSASGASPEPPEIALEEFEAAAPAISVDNGVRTDAPSVDVEGARHAVLAAEEDALATMPQIRPWWEQRTEGHELRPGLANPNGSRPVAPFEPAEPAPVKAVALLRPQYQAGSHSEGALHAEADRPEPPEHAPLAPALPPVVPFRPSAAPPERRPLTGATPALAPDPAFAASQGPLVPAAHPGDIGSGARRPATGTSIPAFAPAAALVGASSDQGTPDSRTGIRLQVRHEPEEASFDAGNIEELLAQRRALLQDVEVEPPSRSWVRTVVIACAAISVVGLLGYYLGVAQAFETWRKPPQGTLRLESKPVGATVFVDGSERGRTPLTLAVAPGDYRVEMLLGDEAKAMTVPVENGGEAYQIVSLYPAGPPGTLEITSAPSGVTVSIDGEPRGSTPLSLSDIAPGEHVVSAATPVARVEQTVEVMAGASVPVMLPVSGVIEVRAPFEVSIYDRSKAIGVGRAGKFEVPAGKRLLSFINDELLFEEDRAVDVPAGQVVRVDIVPPTGVLNFTSDVESEVFLDGRPLGVTPLSNVPVSLGSHQVLYRQPEWGEQQYTILVSMGSPARLHAQMKYKKMEYTPPRNTNPPKPRRR